MHAETFKKRKTVDEMLGSIDDIGPELVTESDLADFWSVSTRQVRTLVSEGAIRKFDSRHFNKAAATRGYIHRLIEQANRKTDPELRAEKLRLAKEQADKLEIANAESRKELVSAVSVENAWSGILRDVRAGMLAISGRLQSRLPHLTAHDVQIIDSEIKSALREMADGND